MELILQHRNQLIIYPLDQRYQMKNANSLGRYFSKIGFIDSNSSTHEGLDNLMPGNRFMKLLVFLGCSPSLGSDQTDSNYNNYHVEINSAANEPVALFSPRLRAPNCPACNTQDKQALAGDGIRMDSEIDQWQCKNCSARTPILDINWRHRLAIATHYISVTGVHDGEVIPADELLTGIAAETGVEWSYCYR